MDSYKAPYERLSQAGLQLKAENSTKNLMFKSLDPDPLKHEIK